MKLLCGLLLVLSSIAAQAKEIELVSCADIVKMYPRLQIVQSPTGQLIYQHIKYQFDRYSCRTPWGCEDQAQIDYQENVVKAALPGGIIEFRGPRTSIRINLTSKVQNQGFSSEWQYSTNRFQMVCIFNGSAR